MIKDKAYYLAINYDIIVSKLSEKEGGGHLAYYQDIEGIMGDGESKEQAVKDVKSAFSAYVDVALENKNKIPEPVNLSKPRKINISMTGDRINNLDIYAKRLNTNRSGLLSILTDKLINDDIKIKR